MWPIDTIIFPVSIKRHVTLANRIHANQCKIFIISTLVCLIQFKYPFNFNSNIEFRNELKLNLREKNCSIATTYLVLMVLYFNRI